MDSNLILFGPDSNLAHYVRQRTSKEIISIPEYGLCPTHHQITVADLADVREKYPKAKLVVHPECIPEIQEAADHIASTSGIVRYCKASAEKEFLIGTEVGMLHRLEKEIPGKRFYPLSRYAVCPHMKMHTLEKVERVLETEEPEITVRKGVADKAREAIERMLELSS
jgi:quinolinate synthase